MSIWLVANFEIFVCNTQLKSVYYLLFVRKIVVVFSKLSSCLSLNVVTLNNSLSGTVLTIEKVITKAVN